MFGMLNDSSATKATNTAPVEATEEVVETGETTEVETESEAVENTDDTTSEDTTENSDSEDSGDTDTEVKKPKKGFERRIERFNQKLSQKDQEIEYWRKAAMGSGNTQGTQREVAPEETAKPQFANYNDIESYTEALTDWKVSRALNEVGQKQQVANIVSTYDQRVQEFRKVTPDFQEVMDEFIEDYGNHTVPEIIQTAMDSQVGPQIAYYLAKNPTEVDRIAGLPPHRRLLELGKIEDRLSAKTNVKNVEVEKKKVSKAPAPIESVKGGGKVETRSLYDDDLPYDQWVKLREKKK